MTAPSRPINVGVVGLGLAGFGILPSITSMPTMHLAAVADTNDIALRAFRERYEAKTYRSIEELCDDPAVDAVWIATPNTLHCPHVVLAAERGKHVIVEKPMAISIAEAERMIEATEKHGVQFLCGGSRSSSSVVRKMREIVRSGELGRLRAMTTWSATAWMLAPRRPDELDVAQGGGVAFRQSPHQIDSTRLLAGGIARSVRAITGQWMEPRHTAPGYFSALIEFEEGVSATLIYSGYGYFMASELFEPGASGPAAPDAAGRVRTRQEIRAGSRDEAAAKHERALATHGTPPAATRPGAGPARSRFLADLGLLVVFCDHGDMRQSPNGLYVYSDEGNSEIPLEDAARTHSPELEELYQALTASQPILHGGRWGLATLEVSLAIMQSAREHREIFLERQVPVPEGY